MKLVNKIVLSFLLCGMGAMNASFSNFFKWFKKPHCGDGEGTQLDSPHLNLHCPSVQFGRPSGLLPDFDEKASTDCPSKEAAIIRIDANSDKMVSNFISDWKGFAAPGNEPVFFQLHLYESAVKLGLEMLDNGKSFAELSQQFPDNTYVLYADNLRLSNQFKLNTSESYVHFVKSLQSKLANNLPTDAVVDYKKKVIEKIETMKEAFFVTHPFAVGEKAKKLGISEEEVRKAIGLIVPRDKAYVIFCDRPNEIPRSSFPIAEYWWSKQYFFEKPFAFLAAHLLGMQNVHNTTIFSRFTDGQVLKTVLMGIAASVVGLGVYAGRLLFKKTPEKNKDEEKNKDSKQK